MNNLATIVSLKGKLDSSAAAHIQDEVLNSAAAGERVLIDMSGVTYLSSAGLRMLLLLYRKVEEGQGKIALTGLTEKVADIMAVTGFLDLFETYETRSEGLEAFQKVS